MHLDEASNPTAVNNSAHVPTGQAAIEGLTREAWTLLAIGLLVTILRTCSRVRLVSFKGLKADDYLVWVAAVCYLRAL